MEEKKDEIRIMEAAADRFMDAGLYKVTMDEIASDLRVSKKTIYKSFPSKEILLRSIVQSMMHRVEGEIQSIISSEKPFEEKLSSILALVGTIVGKLSHPFMRDIQRFAPGLWKEIETFRREKIFSKIFQMLRQARKEGVFREDLNIDLFYLVLTTAMQGIMNPLVLSQQPFSAEEAFKGIFRILYEGALTDDARKRFQLKNNTLSSHETTR
ncbi:MAG: TetR/AcrR family transcriptional regulator [Ignavibacteriae bacterium]|nr:MAG: TetR/AcrR family transcriptional regulator [Ignavibacteriota bacterium]